MALNSICVYCGSSVGRRSEYLDGARAFGQGLAARGIRLVYGGGSIGLMGALADAVLAAGGSVTGVIPQALVDRELAHAALTELVVTGSMHERKARMAERADAFVALPGGIGTLEELFEIWTWAQLGLHRKPCGLLNVGGYFDGLIAFLGHAVDERFVDATTRSMLSVAHSGDELLDALARYEPPPVPRWMDAREI